MGKKLSVIKIEHTCQVQSLDISFNRFGVFILDVSFHIFCNYLLYVWHEIALIKYMRNKKPYFFSSGYAMRVW